MKILVAGSRNYYDYAEFSDIMNFIHEKNDITEIISGRGTAHNFKLCKNNNTRLVYYNFKLHKVVEV